MATYLYRVDFDISLSTFRIPFHLRPASQLLPFRLETPAVDTVFPSTTGDSPEGTHTCIYRV